MANRICTTYVIEEEHMGMGKTYVERDDFPSLEWAKLELEERFKTYKKLGQHEIEWHEGKKLITNISKDKDYFYVHNGAEQIICSVKEKRIKKHFGF